MTTLAEIVAPTNRTLDMWLQATSPGAYTRTDDEGNTIYYTEDGNRIRDFDAFDVWRDQSYLNDLQSAGYVNVSMLRGVGLNDDVFKRSSSAQARGINSLNDYLRYEFGAGTFEQGPAGDELYKGTTATARDPFDLLLSEAMHWTGKLALAFITFVGGQAALGAISGTAAAAADATVTEAQFLAADAAQLSAQGLSEAQVASTLEFGGFDAFAAADAAQLAANGIGTGQLGQVLTQSYGAGLEGVNAASGASLLDVARTASNAVSTTNQAQTVATTAKTVTSTVSAATGAAGALAKLGNIMGINTSGAAASSVPANGMKSGGGTSQAAILGGLTPDQVAIGGALALLAVLAMTAEKTKGG